MTPDEWRALSEADKDVWRRRFQRERQNKGYSAGIDVWYARDVYRAGKGVLLLGVVGGVLGLGIFGLLFLAMGLGI